MAIRWSPAIECGDGAFDRQHKELLAKLAELLEALRWGDRSEIEGRFDALGDRGLSHFASEEKSMEAAGYPHHQAHREAHQAFVAALLEIKHDCTAKGPTPSVVSRVSTWIPEWIRFHMAGSDRALGRHLSARGTADGE